MNKKILTILTFLILQVTTFHLSAAIGDWKAYMAYHEVQEIEQAGNLVFVQASNNLYVYNKNDQSIQTFSKMDYLNDCEIQHIAYNKTAKRLLIIYTNSNIDLMNINNYEVTNLSDYYTATTTGEKSINDIYINGKYAYMSNGFGIVKVNVADAEISNTYNLGFKVNWCEIKDNYIYAYSQTYGAYRAPLTVNLLDKNNWNRVGNYVDKQQEDKSELQQLVSTLNPGGPKYNNFWYLKFFSNQLYTCGGAFLSGIISKNNPGTIQVLKDDNWTFFQDQLDTITGYNYVAINCVEPDINNSDHVFASGKTGVYEFYKGKLQNYYNKDNSIFEGAVDGNNILGNNYVLVHSVLSDPNGSFWFLNSQAKNNSIIEMNTNKEFIAHPFTQLMGKDNSLAGMVGLMRDSQGYIWFVNNNSGDPCIVKFQPLKDSINVIRKPFYNQDGTDINLYKIKTIQEDNNHNLWIATDLGPFYLSREDIQNNNSILTQFKVPRNDGTNYADYLLGGVDINSIAIDKGNRKWFGTNNDGIYLISNDNTEQIHHFTTSNSPLLSNGIQSLAINNNTGEVYIATDKGLCSYMSDASNTNTEMTTDNVWAYPNPVKPDYTGLISITGLSFDSDVKIVSANGTLVNQGRSTGGTYTWNGCDLKGKKVASGIYMVETATSEGTKGTVCKIAIIR